MTEFILICFGLVFFFVFIIPMLEEMWEDLNKKRNNKGK
jgi:hypothetical protein